MRSHLSQFRWTSARSPASSTRESEGNQRETRIEPVSGQDHQRHLKVGNAENDTAGCETMQAVSRTSRHNSNGRAFLQYTAKGQNLPEIYNVTGTIEFSPASQRVQRTSRINEHNRSCE